MTTTYPNPLQTIDASTLKQLIDRNATNLIDVREPSEYAGERIPGAKLIPLSRFDPQQVPRDIDRPLVLYCRSSNRSSQAAQKLFAAGFPTVTHLQGGMNAWKEAGYETHINKNAPMSLMRQVQIVAGSLMLIGTLLGVFLSPWFLILSGFVGAGLIFAGITDTCGMAMLLAKLPYNQNNIQ